MYMVFKNHKSYDYVAYCKIWGLLTTPTAMLLIQPSCHAMQSAWIVYITEENAISHGGSETRPGSRKIH